MTSGEITLDPSMQTATLRDMQHLLSGREFALLCALIGRPGRILSRSQIESRIFGWGDEVQCNAVNVLIHGLSKKCGKYIVRNVRNAGWMVTRDNT